MRESGSSELTHLGAMSLDPGLKAPELPGLHLIDPDPANLAGQIIYLDLDGEEDVTYDGPVTIGPFDVPVFQAPDELVGQEHIVIAEVLDIFERTFAGFGVVFVTEQPLLRSTCSTVYIGGDGTPFRSFGSFLGLAEQVDVGNLDPSDEAWVFSESIVSD